ncbi:MAG: FAD-dependent oxidoreductase [Microbacterium sp.]
MTSDPDAPVARGFRRLFEPITIGNLTIGNRIFSPTHGASVSETRDLRFLQERARGGAGLLGLGVGGGVHEYSVGPERDAVDGPYDPAWDGVLPSPLSRSGVQMYDDKVIPVLSRRAAVIHGEGSHCYAQVAHGGAADHWPHLRPHLGPSSVADPYEGHVPHALTSDEIGELTLAFAHGVRRVKEAGVDAAELHGAHGYLLAQFLSPFYNRREDAWGGSVENRAKIILDIITAARGLVGPEYPIGIRIGCDGDGRERGLTVAALVETCVLLAPHVAYISISNGNYTGFGLGMESAYVASWYREPGFNVPVAAEVKRAVDVPVLVTGRIIDPSIAESILADGAADMIGMVRALIADPELPRKTRDGRAGEIRMCVGLSECHHAGKNRVPMTCAVNAAAAREAEMEIHPAAERKTVIVVGAGPAGMEAARVAALRGHEVYLCDAERELGGTIRVLAMDPNRRNLLDHRAYFETELERLGVQMVLGNRVDADELVEFGADAVIVATGGVPIVPDVDGIAGANVVGALDVLRGVATVGENVLVVAGHDNHLAAPTLAELLVDQGRRVQMISEHVDFAHGVEEIARFAVLHRLKTKGVRISMLTRLAQIVDGDAIIVDAFTADEQRIRDATVVLACGLTPNDRLARQLAGRVGHVALVGDALAPRRLMHATIEGARAALRV